MNAVLRPFRVDLRSLALFRVFLSICLLADWKARLDDLTVFHTDMGVLPRVAVMQFWDSAVINSIFMATGGYWGTLLLFLIEGLIFLCLLFGWRTKLMSVLALIFVVSQQARNYAIVQGSDDLLRMLLFWAVFLPIGQHFSIDAALDDRPRTRAEEQSLLSFLGIGLLLQSSYVYVIGALVKATSTVWWPDGTAIYYAMNIDQFTTIWSPYLREFPGIMQLLTYFVWVIELIGPILMLLPFVYVWMRALVLPLLVAMHTGFILFLTVGLFPFVSFTSLTPFIPGEWWDWLERKVAERRARLAAMWYDEPCLFCYKTCLLLRGMLLLGPVPIRPAQSDPEMGRILREQNSWVVVDGQGRPRTKWDALAAVFEASPIFFWMAPALRVNLRLGDALYRVIGNNRDRLGRLTKKLLVIRPNPIRRSRVLEAAFAVIVAVVMYWNITTIPGMEKYMPDWLTRIFLVTRLEQKWDMFAPTPLIYDGWYVVEGTLVDGRKVDMTNRGTGIPELGPASFDKPADVASMYADQKWRKYLVNLTGEQFVPLRFWYASWVCRQWNSSDDPRLVKLASFQIWFVVEPTPPPGGEWRYERRELWNHRCL